MAEIVSDEIWNERGTRPVGKYPFDEWFDGQTRILTRGEDFAASPRSIQNTIHVNAFRRNIRVRTRIVDDQHIRIRAVID